MKPSLGPLCFQYSTKFIIIIIIMIIINSNKFFLVKLTLSKLNLVLFKSTGIVNSVLNEWLFSFLFFKQINCK